MKDNTIAHNNFNFKVSFLISHNVYNINLKQPK